MAEESKQAFDPDATVQQPAAAEPDPEATVRLPAVGPDADTTLTGPLFRQPDPDATVSDTLFDPDATVNPAERAGLDPDSTVRIPSPGKQRKKNPFAPQMLPSHLQANLAALGGLNPLIELANPILGAVPEIRHALRHPDPERLRDTLATQIEAFDANADTARIASEASGAAVYALCALLDESAAATPWGRSWIERGLLHRFRGESSGGEGFFALLDRFSADPDANADLIEFLYVCMALGFEGRYRNAEGGRQALAQLRDRLYALVARRHPRPVDGLSERWRTPAAQAAADAALATAARVSAARAAAAASSRESAPEAAQVAPRFALSRLPRRAVWGILAGVIGSLVVFYLLALRLLEEDVSAALVSKPRAKIEREVPPVAAPPAVPVVAPAPTPAPAPARASLATELGEAVSVTVEGGSTIIAIRNGRQFAAGSASPAAELRPVIDKIATALERVPGAILVTGHSDALPISNAQHPSNEVLSAARARSVAQMISARLAAPNRVAAEGKGASQPVAANDSEANRARNRRVVISLKAAQ